MLLYARKNLAAECCCEVFGNHVSMTYTTSKLRPLLRCPKKSSGLRNIRFFRPQRNKPPCLLCHRQRKSVYSHSLTSSFPQLLFALFQANFREFFLKFSRFSLYSLGSQPVWYCFGIKVWYQFSEKSAEKKSVILFQQVILGYVLQFNRL